MGDLAVSDSLGKGVAGESAGILGADEKILKKFFKTISPSQTGFLGLDLTALTRS